MLGCADGRRFAQIKRAFSSICLELAIHAFSVLLGEWTGFAVGDCRSSGIRNHHFQGDIDLSGGRMTSVNGFDGGKWRRTDEVGVARGD
jgi:hypothetical protein